MLFLRLQLFQTGLHGGNIPAERFRACILYMLKFLQKQSIFSAQFLQFLRQLCNTDSQRLVPFHMVYWHCLFLGNQNLALLALFLDLLHQAGVTLQFRLPYGERFLNMRLSTTDINAHGEIKRRQLQEVSFSDLTPQEENQLYTYDAYFEHDEAEKSFCVAGKEITAKLLAEALHSLPDDKREAVLLYYFFEMNDAEIAKLRDVPRSTIQYRRTSSFELLKRYLEERAYDCT